MIKDPISGIVDFTQDIKPYHTKIIEVLVDYIYEETMKASIGEEFNLEVDVDIDHHVDYCTEGYGVPAWGSHYSIPLDNTVDGTIVLSNSYVFNIIDVIRPNALVVAGDQTLHFSDGVVLSIVNSFANDGTWKVLSSTYVPSANQTRLQVTYDQSRVTLKMFAVTTFNDPVTYDPINVMYITGRLTDFFNCGDTLSLTESLHGHNGTWLINKICDNVYFSAVTVQHITDPTPGGVIVLPLLPAFNIIAVDVLSRTHTINDEYDNEPDSGCDIQYSILNKLEPSAAFVLSGNQQNNFNILDTFTVTSSLGNDGVWTTTDVSYDLMLNQTKVYASFSRVSNVEDTSDSPNDLFMTWDPVYGFGLGGLDLDLPLTSSVITTYSVSNFDFPQHCSTASPTSVTAKIKEHIDFDISLPLISAPFSISHVTETSIGVQGSITVFGDQRRFFSPNSIFVISGSGSNDGVWTVQSVTYSTSLDLTTVITKEPVGVFVQPVGQVVLEQAAFTDHIGVNIYENNSPPAWDFYYSSAPTSPIIGVDVANNVVTVSGDVTRFFSEQSSITLQQTVNDIGAWNWIVVQRTYDLASNITSIKLVGPNNEILNDILPLGFISGLPTWVSGIGWDQAGWSHERDPLVEIVDMPVGSNVPVYIHLYGTHTLTESSYDFTTFDLGGFGDTLHQVLPL